MLHLIKVTRLEDSGKMYVTVLTIISRGVTVRESLLYILYNYFALIEHVLNDVHYFLSMTCKYISVKRDNRAALFLFQNTRMTVTSLTHLSTVVIIYSAWCIVV